MFCPKSAKYSIALNPWLHTKFDVLTIPWYTSVNTIVVVFSADERRSFNKYGQ